MLWKDTVTVIAQAAAVFLNNLFLVLDGQTHSLAALSLQCCSSHCGTSDNCAPEVHCDPTCESCTQYECVEGDCGLAVVFQSNHAPKSSNQGCCKRSTGHIQSAQCAPPSVTLLPS